MDAKAIWKQGMSFDGTADSGFTIRMGASAEFGGADDGMRPMELVLVGLAGCTAMDVISILQKKRQEVTGFEVRAHADRATDHPKVFTHVVLEFVVTGKNIDRAAVERAVELSETKYCSAQAMLSKAVEIEHKITLVEA
ncbi:MAG: OsmC family protein [Anaerolineaceae bacterium]|nr:OsmC family protein [Anaerolineaceae bacterium]